LAFWKLRQVSPCLSFAGRLHEELPHVHDTCALSHTERALLMVQGLPAEMCPALTLRDGCAQEVLQERDTGTLRDVCVWGSPHNCVPCLGCLVT
jgi:hypothetical protein